MSINIECESDIALDLDYEDIIYKVVAKTLELEEFPYEVELNFLLTDNNVVQEINKKFRKIDSPTDVLSFPMIEFEEIDEFFYLEDEIYDKDFNPETGELVLGDIVISVEKIIGQAQEYGHSTKRELAFLVAHSMLHLFGYDHEEEEERLIMESKQKKILLDLNIGR